MSPVSIRVEGCFRISASSRLSPHVLTGLVHITRRIIYPQPKYSHQDSAPTVVSQSQKPPKTFPPLHTSIFQKKKLFAFKLSFLHTQNIRVFIVAPKSIRKY